MAGQCLREGLVDEILVYVLPVLLGDGIPFSAPGLPMIDLQLLSSERIGRRDDPALPPPHAVNRGVRHAIPVAA